jgi:hypothetical protein
MDLSSPPKYPTYKGRASATGAEDIEERIAAIRVRPIARPQRGERIAFKLVLVAAFGLLLYWLRCQTHPAEPPIAPPPPLPLEFKLVQDRYVKIQLFQDRAEVEQLLGPPCPEHEPVPEFVNWERLAEHSHRHMGIPDGRIWERWIDPEDKGKWVAVLFAGERVYSKGKKGF